MSIFHCSRCDRLSDADDGCAEDPSDDGALICATCMDDLEADADRPDADTTERQPSPREEQNPSAPPKEVNRER